MVYSNPFVRYQYGGIDLIPFANTYFSGTSVKVGIYLGESCAFKETTEVVRKSLDPQFGKSFDFKLPHDKLQNAAILLEVQQHGYVHKSTIGYVHIGLKASKRGRNYWKEVVGFSDFNRECFLDIQRVKPSKIC